MSMKLYGGAAPLLNFSMSCR